MSREEGSSQYDVYTLRYLILAGEMCSAQAGVNGSAADVLLSPLHAVISSLPTWFQLLKKKFPHEAAL